MLIIILYTGETLLISHSQKVGTTISLIPSSETLISRREVWEGSQGPEQYLHRARMSGALAQQKSIVSSTFLVQFFLWPNLRKYREGRGTEQYETKPSERKVCLFRHVMQCQFMRHVSYQRTKLLLGGSSSWNALAIGKDSPLKSWLIPCLRVPN